MNSEQADAEIARLTAALAAREAEVEGLRVELADCMRVQASVRESESRLRSFVAQASEGFALVNAQGVIVEWNPAYAQITGLTRAEAVGQYSWDIQARLAPPALRQQLTADKLRSITIGALRNRQVPHMEHAGEQEIYTPKGESKTIFQIMFGISDADEYYLGVILRDITAVKRADRQRIDSETRFNTAFRTSPIAFNIFRLDDGHSIDVNDAFLDLVGYTRAQMLGHSGVELDLFTDPDARKHWMDALRETGTVFPVETALRTASGEIRHALFSLKTFRMDGIPVAMTVAVDITAHKRAEQALHVSREQYHALFENIQEGFSLNEIILDEDGQAADIRILNANAAYEGLIGLKPQELIGKRLSELTSEVTPEILQEFARVALTGAPRTFDFYSPRFERHFHMHAFCPRHGQFGLLLEDVSAQKRAETQLQFQSSLLSQVHNAVIVIDLNNIITYWNDYAQALYQWTAAEAIGKNIIELLSPEEMMDTVARNFADLNRDGHWEGEFDVKRKDGSTISAHITTTYLRDAAGNNIGFIGVSADISDRKRAERALRFAEERWRSIFELLPVGVSIVDSANALEDSNPALSQILEMSPEGLARGEYAARRYLRADGTPMLPEEFPSLRAAQSQATVRDVEIGIVKEDGAAIWTSVSAAPMALGMGTVTVTVDITARKRAEADLLASERRFRQVLENSLDASYKRDLQTDTYEYLSPAFERISGYTPDEFRNLSVQSVLEIMHPDDLPEIERVIAASMTGGAGVAYAVDYRLRHKTEGSYRWLHDHFVVLHDAEGKPLARIGSVSDITLRKRAEDALRLERNLLRTVIDIVPDQIFAKDRTGHFVLNNRADAAVMGIHNPELLVGKNDLDVYPAELANAFRTDDEKVMANNQPLYREEPSTDIEGNPRWVTVSKVPWRESGGEVIGLVGIARDITLRRNMELALEQANVELQAQLDQVNMLQDQLREQAIRDPLTHLYNRRYLNETLPREIARTLRSRQTMGILMLDLDHFKRINDLYGHLAGDECLQLVAHAVARQLRASDIVCRYGGEEIVCVLFDTTQAIAYERAETLRTVIAELAFSISGEPVRLTASIGVAVLPPDGTDLNTALQSADDALYRAKEDGRNCVRLRSAGTAD